MLADRAVRFSDELETEYFRQLTAEVHDTKDGWRKEYDRNETLDMMVYAFAAGMHHSVMVNRMRELDWLRFEEAAKKAPSADEAILPTAPKTFTPTRAIFR